MVTSVRRRLSLSLAGNVVRGLVTVASATYVAKWLGPEEYGRFAFLLVTTLAITRLSDFYISSCFFTLISEKQRSVRYFHVYWGWCLLQIVILTFLIWTVFPDALHSMVWGEEPRFLVLLALLASFMQHTAWLSASQIAEAQRKTWLAQLVSVALVVLHFVLIIILSETDVSPILGLYFLMLMVYGAGSIVLALSYEKEPETNQRESYAAIIRELVTLALPMLPMLILGIAHEFLDRWLLQIWGGAVQQGIFSIAFQYSTIVGLVTVSLLRVFWKEIAEAVSLEHFEEAGEFFHQLSKLLLLGSAIVCFFILPWGESVIVLLLGDDYSAFYPTFLVLMLYPVFGGISQLSATFLLAAKHTVQAGLFGAANLLLGILGGFWVLAPPSVFEFGLQSGSFGLGIKLVLVQVCYYYLMTGWILREYKWGYKIFRHQIVVLFVVACASSVAFYISNSVFSEKLDDLYLIMVGGLIFLILMICIIFVAPTIAGTDRRELRVLLGINSRL